jgi:hypothetical protein
MQEAVNVTAIALGLGRRFRLRAVSTIWDKLFTGVDPDEVSSCLSYYQMRRCTTR